MGKSRKPRKGLTSRDDPVGLDSAILELEKGLDLEFEASGASSIVENIIAQLQSGTCHHGVHFLMSFIFSQPRGSNLWLPQHC